MSKEDKGKSELQQAPPAPPHVAQPLPLQGVQPSAKTDTEPKKIRAKLSLEEVEGTKYTLTIRLTPDQIDDILDLGQSITLVKSVGGLKPAAWHVIPPSELAEKITITWEEKYVS